MAMFLMLYSSRSTLGTKDRVFEPVTYDSQTRLRAVERLPA